MSFNCTKHGWQHLLNACPDCYTVTASNMASSLITSVKGDLIEKSLYDAKVKECEELKEKIRSLQCQLDAASTYWPD